MICEACEHNKVRESFILENNKGACLHIEWIKKTELVRYNCLSIILGISDHAKCKCKSRRSYSRQHNNNIYFLLIY